MRFLVLTIAMSCIACATSRPKHPLAKPTADLEFSAVVHVLEEALTDVSLKNICLEASPLVLGNLRQRLGSYFPRHRFLATPLCFQRKLDDVGLIFLAPDQKPAILIQLIPEQSIDILGLRYYVAEGLQGGGYCRRKKNDDAVNCTLISGD